MSEIFATSNLISLAGIIVQILLVFLGIYTFSVQKKEKENIKIANLLIDIKYTYDYIQAWSTYIFTTHAPRNINCISKRTIANYDNHKALLCSYKLSRVWDDTKSLLIIRLSKPKKFLFINRYNYHMIKSIMATLDNIYSFAETLSNFNNRIKEITDRYDSHQKECNQNSTSSKKIVENNENKYSSEYISILKKDPFLRDLWEEAFIKMENYNNNSNEIPKNAILNSINKILPKDLRYE